MGNTTSRQVPSRANVSKKNHRAVQRATYDICDVVASQLIHRCDLCGSLDHVSPLKNVLKKLRSRAIVASDVPPPSGANEAR